MAAFRYVRAYMQFKAASASRAQNPDKLEVTSSAAGSPAVKSRFGGICSLIVRRERAVQFAPRNEVTLSQRSFLDTRFFP
jgi:hypothetical protein